MSPVIIINDCPASLTCIRRRMIDSQTFCPKTDKDEPRHDKTNKMSVRRLKWKLKSLATQWAHSEDSDQTGRMPRLI